MAEVKVKISADASDAVKTATQARQQIVEQFKIAGKEVSETKFNADFDTVFRQLTQFRIGLTQIARGDLGGVPNLIKGIQLAGQQSADVKPKIASLTETVSLLDRSLKVAGSSATGKSVFAGFEAQLIKASDTSTKEGKLIRASFEKLGIDVEKALLNPTKAFQAFITLINGNKISLSSARNLTGITEGIPKLITGLESGSKAVIGLETANNAAAASAQKLSGGLSLMTLGIGAAAIAAVAAVAGVVLLGTRSVEVAEQVRKLKEETGLSATEIQRLQAAAQVLDVDLKTVVGAYKAFNQTVGEVRFGNKELAKEFGILGQSAVDAANDPRTGFEKLVIAISNLKDENVKARAAQDLLKISTGELSAIYKVLTEDGGRLTPRLREVAGVMDGPALEAARKYKEEMGFAEVQVSRLADRIGIFVLPALNALLEKMNQFSFVTLNGLPIPVFRELDTTVKLTTLSIEDIEKKTIDFGNSQTKAAAAVTAADNALKKYYQTLNTKDTTKERQRKLDQAAQDELSATRNKIQEAEAVYREERENIQRNFDRRLIDEDLYTARLKAAIEKRSVAIQIAVANERESLLNSGASSRVTTKISAAIDKDEQARIRERAKALADADFAASQERLRFNRAIEQAQLVAAQVFADRQLSLNQDRLDRGVLAEEEAASRELAVALRLLDAKIKIAEEEVARTGANSNDKKIAQAELENLTQQRVNIEQSGAAKVNVAHQKDLANERSYFSELQQIYDSARQSRLAFTASFTANRFSIIQQAADFEVQAIEKQFAAEQQFADLKLANLKKEADTDGANQEAIIARQSEINNRLIALEEEKNARIALIRRQAKVETENADPLSTRNVVGGEVADAVDGISGKLTGFQTLIQSIGVSFKATINGMAKNAQSPLKTIGALIGSVGANFALSGLAAISAGQSIGAALRSTAQATLAQVAQIAGVKAIQNVASAVEENAKGTASLAVGDAVGAGLHFAAAQQHIASAIKWGLVAGGSAIAAGAIGGGGGASNGGTSQLGSDLSGTRQDDSTRSTEERFRLHERGKDGNVTTIVLVTDRAQLVKDVSYGYTRDFAQGGATKKLLRGETHGENSNL